jgi:RNA 2',3'-cyclic 3'-phosphodiesterase
MTRTFIAVDLGDEARAHLQREVARLGRALPGVRWVDPAKLHLTLAFLGELDDERLAAAEAAALEAARAVKPFTLEVAGLGIFGPSHAPRVIWAGVGGNVRRLAQLHDALAAALAARGFVREERPFSPHLTLARLGAPLSGPEASRLASLLDPPGQRRDAGAPIAVEHLSVMKSELRRPAAVYTCLRAIPLGADASAGDGLGL